MGFFRLQAEYFDGAVKVIKPSDPIRDDRGFFAPEYREDEFRSFGIPTEFVQDNYSVSRKHVVRGLHFQLWPPMGKLMRVTSGSAFLVAVDLRPGPTLLKWIGVLATPGVHVWAPAEFARGFCALKDNTEVRYKCTALFNPEEDKSIRWNDPTIGVEWPTKKPILSDRDKNAPCINAALL